MTKEDLLKDGYIPLIEYEEKFNDRLLISFPSHTYRKGNRIVKLFGDSATCYDIIDCKVDLLTGYRIPTLNNYTEA